MQTLQDIIESIHQQYGIHPVTCRLIARKLFEEIRATLQRQEEVYIESFGRFTFKKRKATIHENVNGGPSTYSPANSTLQFRPERKWSNWQRVHSAKLPEQLPEGTRLGDRFIRSAYIRQQLGADAPPIEALLHNPSSLSFYHNIIIPRAKKKEQKQP